MKQTVNKLFYDIRRKFKLTPILKELEEIKRRGVPLENFTALEMFGGYGDMITKDCLQYVKSLETWEINPDCEASLKKHLPTAKIRIGDSYAMLKEMKTKVDFLSADTALSDNPNEHFTIFPDAFKILNDKAIIMLNTVPEMHPDVLKKDAAEIRKKFYGVEDPANIPIEKMIEKYKALCKENGFEVKWWFTTDRYFMYPLRKARVKKRLVQLVLYVERV
ncbi:MAG: hypothetical protein IPM38_12825 [Ignavibacteria bacterium]|nr:hypothetical protein [Ignavibacteria bacterium]